MKPTKEQLADPKWWDTYEKDGNDRCYWHEKEGSVVFAGDGVLYACYELLAKRPEPEKWVPQVGEWCWRTEKGGRHSYKVFMIGRNSKGSPVFETLPFHNSITCDSGCYEYDPIKSEREEFIDTVGSNQNLSQVTIRDLAGALYDAGCRFDLTKKDGE